MIALFFGDTDFPNIILKTIRKQKIKYLIIDLSKSRKFKRDRNSYSVSIGQFGKIINILKENNFKKVLSIKPGITGLWQVSGRNNLTYKTRVRLDLNYIENYNFLMDIRILIRTIGVILFPLDRGAY